MNRMADVAKLFGKELEEDFKIRRCDSKNIYKARFTRLGIEINCHGTLPELIPDDDFLKELLIGYYEIVKEG